MHLRILLVEQHVEGKYGQYGTDRVAGILHGEANKTHNDEYI